MGAGSNHSGCSFGARVGSSAAPDGQKSLRLAIRAHKDTTAASYIGAKEHVRSSQLLIPLSNGSHNTEFSKAVSHARTLWTSRSEPVAHTRVSLAPRP